MKKKTAARKIWWAAGAALCAGAILFSAAQIFLIKSNYGQADREYAALRQQHDTGGDGKTGAKPVSAAYLAEINPDYIGWLTIPGTAVDYPVVRGEDNTKYLTTTFEGVTNPVGSIFMDSGAAASFDSAHTILYGHNAKDGSMFGGLHRYLEAAYLAQNLTIEITTAEGTTLTYTILEARQTDIQDWVYHTDFSKADHFAALLSRLGAPEDTKYLLTLSTCVSGADRDARMLVHAARMP